MFSSDASVARLRGAGGGRGRQPGRLAGTAPRRGFTGLCPLLQPCRCDLRPDCLACGCSPAHGPGTCPSHPPPQMGFRARKSSHALTVAGHARGPSDRAQERTCQLPCAPLQSQAGCLPRPGDRCVGPRSTGGSFCALPTPISASGQKTLSSSCMWLWAFPWGLLLWLLGTAKLCS